MFRAFGVEETPAIYSQCEVSKLMKATFDVVVMKEIRDERLEDRRRLSSCAYQARLIVSD